MDNYFGRDDDWFAGEREGEGEGGRDLDDRDLDEAVDRAFRQLTNPLVKPYSNECLVCFLLRVVPMLEPLGFAMSLRFRDNNAPRATRLGDRLRQLGISGDAQVLQYGVVANTSIWEVERCPDCGLPDGAPDCFGVRKGSTQPCYLWNWRRYALAQRPSDWLDRRY